jgi:LysR family glycine cleavage system transcriptional activator
MYSLPSLRLLVVFDKIVTLGGFGQAAAALNVTQPAVSQSLTQLERDLGAILLDRSTRPATLTKAGTLLYEATRDGLSRIADAIDQIEHLAPEAENEVTIACSIGIATYWLMPKLAVLSAEMSDIAINVMTTGQGAPALGRGVDLAIRYGAGQWSDGLVSPLMEERLQPVCSPALLASLDLGRPLLQQAPLIHVNVDDPRWITWGVYLRQAGLPSVSGRGLHFTNYVQATQAALNGQGIMLGWRSNSGDLIRQGQLCCLDCPQIIPKDAFYLVAGQSAQANSPTDRVLVWLQAAAMREIALDNAG